MKESGASSNSPSKRPSRPQRNPLVSAGESKTPPPPNSPASAQKSGVIPPPTRPPSEGSSKQRNAPNQRLESKSATEVNDRTVLVRGGSRRETAGAGCLVDGNHILTCRQVVEAALSSREISAGRTVLVSRPSDPEKVSDAVIIRLGEGAFPMRDLVLLRVSEPLYHPSNPTTEFATPLKHEGKAFYVLGQSWDEKSFTTVAGQLAGEDQMQGLVGMRSPEGSRGRGLAGAPVWSDDLNAFVGMVQSSQEDSAEVYCITSRVLCQFYPELPVKFQIPKSDRPKNPDLKVDYNLQFFPDTRSEENGRKLSATFLERLPNNWYRIRITYELLKGAPAARGRYVTFVTYPNLKEYLIVEEIAGTRKVDASCSALIPDFTIAAIGDGGDTRLTLNLKELAKQAAGSQKRETIEDLETQTTSAKVNFQTRKLNKQEAAQIDQFFKKLECKLTYAVNKAVAFTVEDAAGFADANGSAFLGVGNLFLGFIQVSFVDRGKDYEVSSLSIALADELSIGGSWLQAAKARYWQFQNGFKPIPQRGFFWRDNFIEVWTTALRIQGKCSPDPKDKWVAARHLVAAMLQLHGQGRDAAIELQAVGFDARSIVKVLREHLKHYARRDNPIEWSNFFKELPGSDLPPNEESPSKEDSIADKQSDTGGDAARHRPTYAFYNNDQAPYANQRQRGELKDALGNKDYARQMAQLICAKLTPMPFSLGLFGDWGSGKSYFIGLLHKQIEDITTKEKKDAATIEKEDKVFHRKVVQIHFNAWHYLDTSLWANLVCEIFDNLFKELIAREDTPNEKVEKLKKKLTEESALAAEARKALEDARNARLEAEKKLQYAAQLRQKQERTVAGFLDDLKHVVSDADVNKDLEALAKGFGLSRLNESFAELEARAEEARSVAGRFRTLGLALLSPEGRGRRLFFFILALLVPVVLALIVPALLGMKDGELTRSVTATVTLLGSVAAWISAQTKRGSNLIEKLEQTYATVNKAREKARTNDRLTREHQLELDKRLKEETEAQRALQEAQTKVQAIESELRELAPGRRLLKFLEQRAGANDYRQHLGLVSLVRRDFEKLSELLNDGNEPKEGDKSDPPVLNRIVLYIDDLDRCKSDRVIAVLEAVHLLLAFPIFAVVVAVDPRWLRKSLVEHYPTLLLGGKNKNGEVTLESRESLASPQDYLEKIFQVPFQLEPIEKEGFTKLVVDLLPIEKKQPEDEPENTETNVAPKPKENPPPPGQADAAALPPALPPPATPAPAPAAPQIPADTKPVEPATGRAAPPEKEKEKPAEPQKVTLERLQLEEWERAAIQLCYPLFRTPRAVKRLANTYCLIRTGVEAGPEDKIWKQFIGLPAKRVAEYRTPLLMLAVAAAYPGLARQWFDRLLTIDGWQAAAGENSSANENPDWKNLAAALELMKANEFAPFDQAQVRLWLPKVKRYSF